MNRLSIVLGIAFVSYSMGAPKNNALESGDKNYGSENSSDPELENIKKKNGYGDGNVNSDLSTSENPINDFIKKIGNGKSDVKLVVNPDVTPVVKRDVKHVNTEVEPKESNGGGRPRMNISMCTLGCSLACVTGSPTACAICVSGCPP